MIKDPNHQCQELAGYNEQILPSHFISHLKILDLYHKRFWGVKQIKVVKNVRLQYWRLRLKKTELDKIINNERKPRKRYCKPILEKVRGNCYLQKEREKEKRKRRYPKTRKINLTTTIASVSSVQKLLAIVDQMI